MLINFSIECYILLFPPKIGGAMYRSLIICLVYLFFTTYAAEVEDISFDSNWAFGSGSTLSGDTLVLKGDGSVVKASRPIWYIADAANIENLYLVADVYLEDVTTGVNVWERPRFLIMHSTANTVFAANNMDGLIENKWFFTGTKVSGFNKKGVDAIKVEFRVQQCQGTMKIVNPRLLDAIPDVEYSFPFNVPADKSCSIDLKSSEIRPFPKHLISSNTHFLWTSGGWNDTEVRDIIKNRFTLGTLRFPGGHIGNFYDWKSDGFHGDAISQLNSNVWDNYLAGYQFHYSDFASLCIETGATGTLMFNVMQDDVATATDRLRDRISSGIDIGWIEMGNENFYSNQSYGNVENIDEYISHTSALASSLKSVKPDVKVAVNIDHSEYSEGSWNGRLTEETYYDAAVMHPYVSLNTGLPCSYSFATMLSTYSITKHRIEEFKTHFPNIPLLCTEYGVLLTETPKNFMSTLTSADLFLGLLEGNDDSVVQQMGRHMMYHSDNNHVATSYYRDGAVMNRTSMGVMEEMLIQFFTGSEIYSAIGKSAEIVEGVPGIIARAVKRGDSTEVLVVNKLPEVGTLNLTVDGSSLGLDYTMEWFSIPIMGDTLGYPLTEDPLERSSGTGAPTIPAYSISVVTFSSATNNLAHKAVPLNKNKIKIRQLNSGIHFSATNSAKVKILNLAGKVIEEHEGLKSGVIGRNLGKGIYLINSSLGNTSFKKKVLVR